jgi:protein phosphatase
VQALVDEGRITSDEARTHPQRSVILQALDGRQDIEPEVKVLDPQAGDRYLICSDGLTDFVEEADVERVLGHPDVAGAVDSLIGLALEAGAPDNVTVVLLEVSEAAEAERPDDHRDAATHEPGGVLVGAVGETAATNDPAPALAAASTEPDSPATADVGDDEAVDPPRARRRRWPWLVVLAVLVLVGASFAVRALVDDQWYVGDDNGMVTVFSGVDVSIGPFSLSQVEQRTSIETATLPEFQRERVEQGIKVSSSAAAAETVAQLQLAAGYCLANPSTAGCP